MNLSQETQVLIKQCRDFIDDWHQFKLVLAKQPVMLKRDPLTDSLTMITWHIITQFDGAMILTENCRPDVAKSAIRSIYEGFLNLLLLTYHRGTIETKLLRDKKYAKPLHTNVELAQRYIAFADFIEMRQVDRIAKDRAWWEEQARANNINIKSARQAEIDIRAKGITAASEFDFDDKTQNWHFFRGFKQLREHIWPMSGRGIPIFPAESFGITTEYWTEMFHNFYWVPSHHLHGSAAIHFGMGRPTAERSALIEDRRYDDPKPLGMALGLTVMATGVFADGVGQLPLWNRCIREVE